MWKSIGVGSFPLFGRVVFQRAVVGHRQAEAELSAVRTGFGKIDAQFRHGIFVRSMPADHSRLCIEIVPLQRKLRFVPTCERRAAETNAGSRPGRQIGVFVEVCDRRFVRSRVFVDEADVGAKPGEARRRIRQKRSIRVAFVQHHFEECAEQYIGNVALSFGIHDWNDIQHASPHATAQIVASPGGIELAVVGVEQIDAGLETTVALVEVDARVLSGTHVRLHVAVVAALDDEVAHVVELRRFAARLVLLVRRCNRNDAAQVEVVVERDATVVWVVRQTIEQRRDSDGFAAARVADQRNVVEVDLAVKPAGGILVPLPPQAQVFEQHPSARVVLLLQAAFNTSQQVGVRAVEEVLVHGHGDDAAAREQLAEIRITGIGEILHVVIAVHHQHERKRAVAVRKPDAAL